MTEPSARLTLADLMALLAAVAIGCGICRSLASFQTLMQEVDVWRSGGESIITQQASRRVVYLDPAMAAGHRPLWRGPILYVWDRLAFWPGPIVAPLTVAVLILGWRGPRRGRERIAARPGIAACLAVAIALAMTALQRPMIPVGFGMTGGNPDWLSWWIVFWFDVPAFAGFAVAVAWLVLAAVGRWPSTDGPIDRIGRICGVCWLVMAATRLAAAWLRVLSL